MMHSMRSATAFAAAGQPSVVKLRRSPQDFRQYFALPVCNGSSDGQHFRIQTSSTRRSLLLELTATLAGPVLAVQLLLAPNGAASSGSNVIQDLEEQAFTFYSNRDFPATLHLLDDIIKEDPSNPRWYEMRAQVLVDNKDFTGAISDFNKALSQSSIDLTTYARLLAGRALAYEGLGQWEAALEDYTAALAQASAGGESPDPYIVNSRGNCYNSLGMWRLARSDYLDSANLFQQARGFRGRGGTTTQRLDGAVFAASNAALMLVQLGDVEGAVKEMERVARRAPGSADMRAALAALYWSQGRQQAAEDEWEFACDRITVGCVRYKDQEWLRTVRRWPPIMVDLMDQFVNIRST